MNKLFFTFLIALVCAVSVFAQSKTNEKMQQQINSLGISKNVQLEYDKGSDSTKLMGLGEYFSKDQCSKNGLSELSFGMAHNYNGKALPYSVPAFMMTFWVKGKNGAAFSNASALTFVADGEAVEMGNARYAKKGSMEYLNFMMNREQLSKLAAAKSIVIKIGDKAFQASEAHVKMFSSLYKVSDLENQ